jgi:glycosyltransferase involved in cell wall biosynthesis
MSGSAASDAIGVVVIGRNEGERLRRCLHSLGERARRAVYVDSGSTDGSVALARALGVHVVELDTAVPFTAARARNAGLDALVATGRAGEFVQFVDGDCEIEAGWLERAAAELRADPRLVVVFGRRREREREASPYNRLCDLEWDVPVGEALACGGDAMLRVAALREAGGYDATLIAGEEPELCMRLRARGGVVRRLDAPMTIHDAAMTNWRQWWRRMTRGGYVEAEGLARHGRAYPRWRSAWGNLAWAVALPIAVLAAAAAAMVGGALVSAVVVVAGLLAIYALQWLRIARGAAARWPVRDPRLWATSCLLGKWPATQGMFTFWWRRARGGQRRLIEYKSPAN